MCMCMLLPPPKRGGACCGAAKPTLTHFSPPHKADDAHHDVDGDGDDDDAGDDEDVDSTASSLSQLQWSTPKMKKYLKDAETPAWICYILRLHSRRVSRRLKIPIPNFLDNIHS